MLKVAPEVTEKTTECRNGFSCLETGHCGSNPMCEVETAYGENVLCVRAVDWPSCPYHLDFGGARFCVCLVRCEIHRQQAS